MARLVSDTDRAIIRTLQQDARMSYAEVSRATGIPESTVRRRMDRLQERGVIEFAMVADPSRLGYDVRVMIGLKVELGQVEQIAETLRGMKEVEFAAFLTGNFDIMVQIVVRSQEALVRFLTRRLSRIPGIRSVETFLMPHVIKRTTEWILPEVRQPVPGDELLDEEDVEPGDEDDSPAPRRAPLRPRQRRPVM
jgi:Lrp/AsnC family transcriptional regulator, regulator for asnA, asnC and gidA